MKKPKLWYVIADGGRARFVERDEEGAFRTLSSFVSTELHTSAHELGRDRPARVKESASPARSAVEPRRDLHEAAKEDFIRTVADDACRRPQGREIRRARACRAAWRHRRAQGLVEQANGEDSWSRSCTRT